MTVDFNIRPVGASVTATYVEPASNAARSAVSTDLPAGKAVTAVDASLQTVNNPQEESDRLSKQVVIDRAAAEIVYRTVDSRSGIVVRQYPDDARLRSRAYLRTLDMAQQDSVRKNVNMKI